MAKKQVSTTVSSLAEPEEEPAEVYTGNVYEFNGGLTISNNSGPVTVTIYMQGVPNNPPPNTGP